MKLTKAQIEAAAARINDNVLGPRARIHGRADNIADIAASLGAVSLYKELEKYGTELVELCDGDIRLLELTED